MDQKINFKIDFFDEVNEQIERIHTRHILFYKKVLQSLKESGAIASDRAEELEEMLA